jgi:hypothetical protein
MAPPLHHCKKSDAFEIRARAYQIYLDRGDAPGGDVEDWLQAEAELQPVLAEAQVA